jgi:flagellar assembly factor FliW
MDCDAQVLFPEGIVGFSGYKQYVICAEKTNEPFFWLQSVKSGGPSFIVVDPKEFNPGYTVSLTDQEKQILGVKGIDECKVFSIVFVPQDSDKISANLLAPLVINQKQKIGRQIILENTDYSVRHLILDEMLKGLKEDVSSFAQAK